MCERVGDARELALWEIFSKCQNINGIVRSFAWARAQREHPFRWPTSIGKSPKAN